MTAEESETGVARRPLPLRLCEVLEREHVAIHGPMAYVPSWLVQPDHIDAAQVAELLQAPSRALLPGAVEAIRIKLEQLRLHLPATAEANDASRQQLCAKLNEILASGDPLYDYRMLDRNTDLWQLAELLARTADSHTDDVDVGHRVAVGDRAVQQVDEDTPTLEDDRVLLNRLLLEAAFPATAIARADTVRLNQVFSSLRSLRGTERVSSALCLSGGGIRSASFALGVLQGLARAGILDKFDYLSTVSGGGYIGSWLSTWIRRHPQGLPGVVRELALSSQPEPGGLRRVLHPESGAIRFLRSYSHFLNPKAGLLSADTWSWIGLYLRNLTLNWLVLIPLMLLVIALPRLYAAALYTTDFAHGTALPYFVWFATLCATLTLVCITVNRPSLSDPVRPPRKMLERAAPSRIAAFMLRFKRGGWILALGVAPFVLFALVLTLLVWDLRGKPMFALEQIVQWIANTPLTKLYLVLPYIALEHLVLWGELIVIAGWLISILLTGRRDPSKRLLELALMLGAGLATWWVVATMADYAGQLSSASRPALSIAADPVNPQAKIDVHPAHLYALFAVPVVILAVLLGMTLFIGAVSKSRWIEDEDREWWARFGAWVLIVMMAWCVLAAITIFGPVLLLESPKMIASIGGVSGLVAVLLGKSALTAGAPQQGANPSSYQRLIASLGVNTLALVAIIFLVVFLAFLSLLTSAAFGVALEAIHAPPPYESGTTSLLSDLFPPPRAFSVGCGLGDAWAGWSAGSTFTDPRLHLQIVCQTPVELVAVVIIALAVMLLGASLAINLNKFSLHAAYRIRIVRTFLGASRRGDRRPNPFTGFDPLDNVQMHELQPGLLGEADVLNLRHLVETLHAALLDNASRSPARLLVTRMCNPKNDPDGVLEGRLRYYKPGEPVLKALQRSLVESLNRVLEKTPLHETEAFRDVLAGADAAAVARFVRRGNLIFANRLLFQAAFADDIKPYSFPPPPPHKLLHVINVTLNLVHGSRLAWQERKAAPFAVTPLHSGSYYLGYRETREYGGPDGISIGTAAAISGAAVSPNMGYSSSPVVAMLLTLFNVRLGWWLGNPGLAGQETYDRAEPRFSLRPLLAEALGLTDDRNRYVYLSDGGHFENMGLFEMVLRRCGLIVASDAGADPEYQFEDLGNAVRKIRIDLGIPIEFSEMPIHKRGEAVDPKGRYCTLGRIRYSAVDGPGAPDGILVCIKPAVYGHEPQDVLDYAARSARFPQEPTADQFFGESQFESYRQLGVFETGAVCGEAIDAEAGPWPPALVARVCEYLGCEREGWVDEWLAPFARDAVPGAAAVDAEAPRQPP